MRSANNEDIYLYISLYIYIYIYTHTHTHTQSTSLTFIFHYVPFGNHALGCLESVIFLTKTQLLQSCHRSSAHPSSSHQNYILQISLFRALSFPLCFCSDVYVVERSLLSILYKIIIKQPIYSPLLSCNFYDRMKNKQVMSEKNRYAQTAEIILQFN